MCVKPLGPPCQDDAITWKKSHNGKTGFLICKSEILVVKNILPSRGEITFTCNQKCFYNLRREKYSWRSVFTFFNLYKWYQIAQSNTYNQPLNLYYRLHNRLLPIALQTHHVYSRLQRRGNGRFFVVSTWNTRGVFVVYILII